MSNCAVSQADKHSRKEKLYEPFLCKVESVRDLTAVEKLFRFSRKDGRPFGHKPGQFMQVSITGIGEAPISVSSSPTRGDYLEMGVRKTGTLTDAMHKLKSGDVIGMRGPFGTCFDTDAMKGKDLLLISGGCGLAPMRALIQYVEDCRDDFGKVTILYGAKSPDDVLYKNELAGWQDSKKVECQVTVDNVSGGTCWDVTGGSHAAGIFTSSGKIISFAEDLGRHSALDKAVGKCLLNKLPMKGCGVVLSGRVSLEMVTKAARAGIELIAAVSAPSSFAIEAAEKWNITLCGFVRPNRTNVYTHPERIRK